MPMIELGKAHEGGTFWLSTERIVSMQSSDYYGRYTSIRTDDGQVHSTRLEPKHVAALIAQAENEASA